ncbi:helix-turn-helix domain-containing protein [Alkalibacillus sp. S2W]|uniref:helix-turn-helix domain-containing protein n=1 Tax=Alkalibacillus sp. S2W TaxID=3386553 RepID=UPI00398CDA53
MKEDYTPWTSVQVKQVRLSLGLTLKEMAALIGMSDVNLHYIEQGKHSLGYDYIAILEDDYGLSTQRVNRLMRQYHAEQSAETDKERAAAKLDKIKLGKKR